MGVGGGGMMNLATFSVTLTAAQARAELQSLQFANQRAALAVQMSWASVNAVLKVAVAGFLAVAGATAASVMALNEFNKNLVHTAALGDLTNAQMAALGVQIMDLGKKYGLSSTVMAEGTVILAKAGLTMTQLKKAMEPISQLMMANAITFEQAAEIGVMSVNAFGKSYEDLTYLFDVSQHIAQQTLLDIEDLQQGLQYAASTASLAGIEFEELVAMMGVLSQNAMVAGVASRSMNRMMLSIVDHADEVQAWADALGLGIEVIKDGKINITEIIPAFSMLDTSVQTLQDSMEIFSVRGMRAWGILIQHADDYMRLLEEGKAASGVLAATAEKQATSLTYIWGRIREELLAPFRTETVRKQVTGAMEALAEGMKGAAKPLQDVIGEMVKEFAKWAPQIGQVLIALADTLKIIFGLIKWGIEIIIGFNKYLLIWLLISRMIVNSKFLAYVTQMIMLTKMQAIATTEKITQDQIELQMIQAKSAAYMTMTKAVVGLITGIIMLGQNTSRWMKILGALIVTINAATIAYSYLYFAKSAFLGGPVKAAMAVGALAGGIALTYAALSPIKETETVSYDAMAGVAPEKYQRGTSVITRPTFALLDPGEAVSSANKPLDVGGITIYVQGDLVDHDAFFDRLERELSRREIKTRRNYV